MASNGGNETLTGLFGAYASDDEDQSGSGASEGAAGMVLDNNMPDQEEEESDADADLSKLLTPAKLPDVPTVSLPANQDMAGHSPEQASRDGGERSGAVPSTSQVDSRPQLPTELAEPPPGAVDPMVQANVERVMEGKRRSGKLFTEELRRMRAYRNPDFLQKMVEFFGIEDQGTCFPKEIFDPSSLPKEDNYKALQKEWDGEVQRRQALRTKAGPQFQKGPVEQDKRLPQGLSVPVAGTSSKAAAIVAQAKAQALAASESSKRSKWDFVPQR